MSSAWYYASREDFCDTDCNIIVNQLAGCCAKANLDTEHAQHEEWLRSVSLLHSSLGRGLPLLRNALTDARCERVRTVVLEYDFRRRGLRMDCVLLADGLVIVLEFKRTAITGSDRDQVTRYAVNLMEFHEVTRQAVERDLTLIVPILALTQGRVGTSPRWPGTGARYWTHLVNSPLECDPSSLSTALSLALANRRSDDCLHGDRWVSSAFSPSSTIVDAAVSLYGGHDVVAVKEHGAALSQIQAVTDCARSAIDRAVRHGERLIVFITGAPGSGKTLVGLDLALRSAHAADTVFVTGNAPLVDVLHESFKTSYKTQMRRRADVVTGFRKHDATLLAEGAIFKIVAAHKFLGSRGSGHAQQDGRILVFDEAQRTLAKGKRVAGVPLAEDEAQLILRVQRLVYPSGGLVVVALIGHNQTIGEQELGVDAWLDAATREGWSIAISNESLEVIPQTVATRVRSYLTRQVLTCGHLEQSIRYYRNSHVARWADAVLADDDGYARRLSAEMQVSQDVIWLSRDLPECKRFVRSQASRSDRYGLLGSGRGRRLAAEGLFVDRKPAIAPWMLKPTDDCRSSNALEEVQNQYQIQGLELDGAVVCWDLDLRRGDHGWNAYELIGSKWTRYRHIDVAKDGYRVLLTRPRKSLVVFVPRGDASGADATRPSDEYDRIAAHLLSCGATRIKMA